MGNNDREIYKILSIQAKQMIQNQPKLLAKITKANDDRFRYFEPDFYDAFGLELSDYWLDDILGFDYFKFFDWITEEYRYEIEQAGKITPRVFVEEHFGLESAEIIDVLISPPIKFGQ